MLSFAGMFVLAWSRSASSRSACVILRNFSSSASFRAADWSVN